jgi:hypothetical protein
VGLLHSKLKEFLDLEQGKHTVFNYTRQFNTLAEYGSHHVDTNEKKAILFHKGLTIQLQDRLVQSPNLSYNYLASAAIDQERTMKAVVETEEKKRKTIMPGSSRSGGSGGAPPKYCMCIPHPQDKCVVLHNNIEAIACNTNSSSSNYSSTSTSSSTVLPLQHCSRQ